MNTRTRHLTAALLCSALPFSALSCKKEEKSSPGTPSAGAESSSPAAGGSAELSASAWGFAARLPASTEGFVAFYRASDLVEGFLGSNWFKKLSSHPAFGREIQQMLAGIEGDPQAKEVLALVKEIAGHEAVFALGEGCTDNGIKLAGALAPLLKAAFISGMQKSIKQAAEAGAPPAPANAFNDFLASASPEQLGGIISGLAEVDFPPLFAALKAGSVREKVEALMNQAVDSLPPDAQQKIEKATFGVSGNKFQSLKITISKVMPPQVQENMKAQFSSMLGDPAKGAAAAEKVLAKTIEASWGWVDDYLVLGLGRDRSHMKLATIAESVIGQPKIAPRAAAWQGKKPVMLSYLSEETNRAMGGMLGRTFGNLASLAESAKSSAPFSLDALIADLKKLDARSIEIWPNDPDATVSAAWWDGGLHVEMFGGPKMRGLDCSKPLTFGSLAGPATVFQFASRVNEAESDKTYAFMAEASSTLYESFQKNVMPSLPNEQRNQITVAAGVGVGMIQGFWKNFQQFRGALGGESAVLVNLDGTMPPLPNVPGDLKDAKVPRLVFVSDLKDRALLTEAWKGIGATIGLVMGLANIPATEPAEQKDGELTTWGYKLPMDTGDLWPHTGVSGNRWFFGTSPALTKEIAAKSPAPSGEPSGMQVRVNFGALWSMADDYISRIPAEGAAQKSMMGEVMPLLRALAELDARCGNDKGTAHHHLFLRVTDVK